MFDSMMEWMAVPMLCARRRHAAQAHGPQPPLRSRPTACSQTADGVPILISIQNDREWAAFCTKVLERPELATDARFATNPARLANRAETDGLVARCFSAQDIEPLSRRLEAAEIAFARVNDVEAILHHPHLRRADGRLARRRNRVAEPSRTLDRRGEPELRPATGARAAYRGRVARVLALMLGSFWADAAE